MYNNYTIELRDTGVDVKAHIYQGTDKVGSVWIPGKMLTTKEQFEDLLRSVADIIYGKEFKAKEDEKSYCEGIKAIKAKDKAFLKSLQQKEI